MDGALNWFHEWPGPRCLAGPWRGGGEAGAVPGGRDQGGQQAHGRCWGLHEVAGIGGWGGWQAHGGSCTRWPGWGG